MSLGRIYLYNYSNTPPVLSLFLLLHLRRFLTGHTCASASVVDIPAFFLFTFVQCPFFLIAFFFILLIRVFRIVKIHSILTLFL